MGLTEKVNRLSQENIFIQPAYRAFVDFVETFCYKDWDTYYILRQLICNCNYYADNKYTGQNISLNYTDENGKAKLSINVATKGNYQIAVSYLGNDKNNAVTTAKNIKVNVQATKATFKKATLKVKKAKSVKFTLKDSKGKAIKGKKITIKVNGKTFSAKTNSKGVATIKVKVAKKGKFTAVAKFAGDSTYKSITKKAKFTVKK
jgi:plastocyanin